MSYFDDASLVMIPSGYKTSKVYSIKPTDGTGDLTFTRSNDTATRVGPDGLIEKVRTNLATYSEDWTNWTLFQSTATANTTANPLTGTLTADTLTISTSTYGVSYRAVSTGLNVATFSAYLKAGTHNFAQIGFTDSTDYAVNVNLTLGTIVGVSSGMTGTITSVGSGWYRVTATRTIATTSTPNAFVNIISGTVGSTIIVYGGQVELGDIATPYIATTSAAVSVGPVANVPRLDYLNSSCPRLLLEPQRTNIHTYSEQINSWASFSGATITSNAAVSPDGYSSADKINETSTTEFFIAGNPDTVSGSTVYTISFFAKAAERTIARILLGAGTFTDKSAYFNLSTGETTTNATSSSMVNYGNGWWRCIVTHTTVSSPTGIVAWFGPSNNMTNLYNQYAGTAGYGIYAWGCQLEAGAYATSYIPTLGAAVTRGADAASKTGISSLIGQTEGTIFVEAILTHSAPFNEYLVQVRGNNSNRFFIFRNAATNKLGCYALVGATEIYTTLTAAAITGTVKAAFAYKSGSFAFYVNGVQVGTSSATYSLATALTEFFIDQNNGLENGYYTYAQSIVFPTRLSNSDLAALTA